MMSSFQISQTLARSLSTSSPRGEVNWKSSLPQLLKALADDGTLVDLVAEKIGARCERRN